MAGQEQPLHERYYVAADAHGDLTIWERGTAYAGEDTECLSRYNLRADFWAALVDALEPPLAVTNFREIDCPVCRGTGCLAGNGEDCTFCDASGKAIAIPKNSDQEQRP